MAVQVDAAITEDRDCSRWATADITSRFSAVRRDQAAAIDAGPLRAAVAAEADAATDPDAAVDMEDGLSATKLAAEELHVHGSRADVDGTAVSVGSSVSGSVRLVVGVLTGGRNRARRDAVRHTWGADPR